MSKHNDKDSDGVTINRRGLLKGMAWAGTGVVWTLAGGIPRSFNLMDTAAAASGFSFVQISDSHIGFDKAADSNVAGPLRGGICRGPAARSTRYRCGRHS